MSSSIDSSHQISISMLPAIIQPGKIHDFCRWAEIRHIQRHLTGNKLATSSPGKSKNVKFQHPTYSADVYDCYRQQTKCVVHDHNTAYCGYSEWFCLLSVLKSRFIWATAPSTWLETRSTRNSTLHPYEKIYIRELIINPPIQINYNWVKS